MSLQADNKIAELEPLAKANGFEVGRNRVFDAIAAAEVTVNGLLSESPEAAFLRAAKPFLGCNPSPDLEAQIRAKSPLRIAFLRDTPIPEEFDLDEQGLVPPIRNQSSCGQCWNFAGIAGAEIATLASSPNPDAANTNWSEQAIVDCVRSGGCNGDWPSTTLDALKSIGTCDEKAWPYRAQSSNGRCPVDKPHKIDDWGYVGSSSGVPATVDIQKALLAYKCGIVCAVAVDNAWAAYKSGVFRGSYTGINHAVVIVGWKKIGGVLCWKVRNTWDTDYGVGGYIYTVPGANLIGYGAAWVQVGTPAPTPVPPVPPAPPAVLPVFKGKPQTVTIRTPTFGGSVTFTVTPQGDIVPASQAKVSGDCGCEDAKGSHLQEPLQVNWFSLMLNLRRLASDLKAVPIGEAITDAKDLWAAITARDFSEALLEFNSFIQRFEGVDVAKLWADVKAILADIGLAGL